MARFLFSWSRWTRSPLPDACPSPHMPSRAIDGSEAHVLVAIYEALIQTAIYPLFIHLAALHLYVMDLRYYRGEVNRSRPWDGGVGGA